MARDAHFAALERMYRAAPVNAFYDPVIAVREGEADIEIEAGARHHHAADAVHGSVYFKMLDDAAFFAANSLERDVFVLTASFTIYLLKPVQGGRLRAVGRVLNESRTQFLAESVLYDERGRELARGSGVFVRGRTPLLEARGYGR